jgi:membrane-bound inhibitor of C-type lysozyme
MVDGGLGITSGMANGITSGRNGGGVYGAALAAGLVGVGLVVALPGGAWADAGIRADYLCKGRFDASEVTAFFFNDTPSAVVLLEGEGATRLPQAVSASGARYSDGTQSFWVKGDRASWQRGQAPAAACEPRSR